MASSKVELESLSQFCKKGRLGFSCFGQHSLNESETKKDLLQSGKRKRTWVKKREQWRIEKSVLFVWDDNSRKTSFIEVGKSITGMIFNYHKKKLSLKCGQDFSISIKSVSGSSWQSCNHPSHRCSKLLHNVSGTVDKKVAISEANMATSYLSQLLAMLIKRTKETNTTFSLHTFRQYLLKCY